MPYFGGEEDYKKRREGAGKEFGTLEDNEYIFEVADWELWPGKVHPQWNPEGYPSVRLFLKPVAFADDPEAELVYDDGSPVDEEKYVNFWVRTNGDESKPRVGFGPSGPSNARRLIWAAYNTPVKQPLNFEWDDLVGRKFIGSTEKNGEYEEISVVRPYRGQKQDRSETRTRRVPAPVKAKEASLVDAAKEIFNDDEEEY